MADNVRFSPESVAGNVVWMSPDQYLDMSPAMKDAKAGPQAKALSESLKKGEPINEVPSFKLKDGKITEQDGRHRALASKEAGIRMIPVTIEGELPKDGMVTNMRGQYVQLKTEQPKPWSEVSKSEGYRKLAPEQKDQARKQYFEQVIAPRVSKDDNDKAWQQFDKDTRGKRPPTARDIDPTEGMSNTELALAGAGKAFHDVGMGVRSMLPEKIGGTAPGEVEADRKFNAPLMNTTAGAAGNFAGNVALAAPTAILPGANTVLGAAAYGGLYGAAQPADSWGERADNALTAGVLSGGVTGAARAVPSIYKALVDPFTASGQDRLAMDVIGRFAKDPAALKTPGPAEMIPGSRASLAEVTGDPGVAQLQRAAQAASPETANAFADARTARLAARKDALLSVAGQQGEKEAAEAVRDATANRLYKEAFDKPMEPMTTWLKGQVTQLLKRPSIQEAQDTALKLAKEEGVSLKKSEVGSIKGLHYTKMAMDDQIAAAKAAGNNNQVRLLMGTKDQLLTVMDKLSPAYQAAREEYAAASKPINRMEIGRYLYDKLIPALSDLGAERATPQKFAQALKEGDVMAQKATGFKGAKLSDILTTDQQNLLVNLGLDLGRETKAIEAAKVPGSPTAQYLAGKNALRRIMGPLGLPESWAEGTLADVAANRWVSLAADPIEKRVQSRLASMLVDPAAYRAAQAAQQSSAWRMPLSALSTMGRRGLPPVSVGGATYQLNR
ncbi:MAG: hypothetical protein KGP14_01775 [Betaproteobacteria bacterium]|nr:hypothetical protein [Betaproteobacteria bacterium]